MWCLIQTLRVSLKNKETAWCETIAKNQSGPPMVHAKVLAFNWGYTNTISVHSSKLSEAHRDGEVDFSKVARISKRPYGELWSETRASFNQVASTWIQFMTHDWFQHYPFEETTFSINRVTYWRDSSQVSGLKKKRLASVATTTKSIYTKMMNFKIGLWQTWGRSDFGEHFLTVCLCFMLFLRGNITTSSNHWMMLIRSWPATRSMVEHAFIVLRSSPRFTPEWPPTIYVVF